MDHRHNHSNNCLDNLPTHDHQMNRRPYPVYNQYRLHQPTLRYSSTLTRVSICFSTSFSLIHMRGLPSYYYMRGLWTVLTSLNFRHNTAYLSMYFYHNLVIRLTIPSSSNCSHQTSYFHLLMS